MVFNSKFILYFYSCYSLDRSILLIFIFLYDRICSPTTESALHCALIKMRVETSRLVSSLILLFLWKGRNERRKILLCGSERKNYFKIIIKSSKIPKPTWLYIFLFFYKNHHHQTIYCMKFWKPSMMFDIKCTQFYTKFNPSQLKQSKILCSVFFFFFF